VMGCSGCNGSPARSTTPIGVSGCWVRASMHTGANVHARISRGDPVRAAGQSLPYRSCVCVGVRTDRPGPRCPQM
jgi:hypothetical protein